MLIPGEVWWVPVLDSRVTIDDRAIVSHQTGQRIYRSLSTPGLGWRRVSAPGPHVCEYEDCGRAAVWRLTWEDLYDGIRDETACDRCARQNYEGVSARIIGYDEPPPYSREGSGLADEGP